MAYADDRNAMADKEQDMERVDGIWQQVEGSTALVNNGSKCNKWHYSRGENGTQLFGSPAITLGVVAPSVCAGVGKGEAERVRKRCTEDRRAAQLP
eukprot:1058116-Alexandrium_andersonii.AAC.1